MIIVPPGIEEMRTLLGERLFHSWQGIVAEVEARYHLTQVWHTAGKKWQYELKFRKGGKTLCSFLAKPDVFGFMVVFGKHEQEQLEAQRGEFSSMALAVYDAATPYRDGKWILFDTQHEELLADFMKFLLIKRNPDKIL